MPRFMVQVRATQSAESGVAPSQETMLQMMAYNKSLMDAGVMLSGNGLLSSSKGARITFGASGDSAVTPGPFNVETLVSGYWVFEAKDLEEAVEWAKKAPFKEGQVLEVRRVSTAEDFQNAE